MHTKLGKPIPPAEPQLIHGTKAATAATTTATATTASGTSAASTSSPNSIKVVSGGPKINFVGQWTLNIIEARVDVPRYNLCLHVR